MHVEENHARTLPRPPLVPAAAFGSPAPNQLFSAAHIYNHTLSGSGNTLDTPHKLWCV